MKEGKSAYLFMFLGALYLPIAMAESGLPNGKPFIEIQGQIIEVQADVSSLEREYESILAKVSGMQLDLQGQIDALGEEIDALKVIGDNLEATLAQAVADIEEQGGDVQVLFSALSQVNLDIIELMKITDANDARIEALEAEKTAILADLASLDDGLISVISDISDNNLLIDRLEDEVDTLASAKQDDIDGSCPEGTSISTISDDGSLLCATINASGVIDNYFVSDRVWLENTVTESVVCTVETPLGCLAYGTETTFYYDLEEIVLTCPQDFKVSGGGHGVDKFFGNKVPIPQIIASQPSVESDQQGWRLVIRNPSSGNSTLMVRGWAVCLKAQ